MACGEHIFALNCDSIIEEDDKGVYIYSISTFPNVQVAVGRLTELGNPYQGREDLEVIEWKLKTRTMSVLLISGIDSEGDIHIEKNYSFFFDNDTGLKTTMIKIARLDSRKRYKISTSDRCIFDSFKSNSRYDFHINVQVDSVYHLPPFDLLMKTGVNPTQPIDLTRLWQRKSEKGVITTGPYTPSQ